MALKDWKKGEGDYWKSKRFNKAIVVYKAFSNKNPKKLVYKIQIGGDAGLSDYTRKEFKTKPRTLKYARSYMRTH